MKIGDFDYPKFFILELTEHGPHLWGFETAKEVAEFIWGKYLPHLALFVDSELYPLKGGDIDEIKRQLEVL